MGLPNGYTEVQYIESTGTQWINTGFKPNQNTRVKMDCNVIGFNSTDMFLFGARVAAGNTAFYVAADDDNAKWWTCFGNNQWSPNDTCKGKHSIDFNQNVLTLDEKNFTFEKTTFQSSYNLLLFATITNGNVDSQRGKMAVYSCQIYDNGNLIRDFIPCVDSFGAAGLYDLVGRKFYGKAGTGVFLAGPPKVTLPKGYKQLEYIQSSGTQYVDTGFELNQDSRVIIKLSTSETGSHTVFGTDISWTDNGFALGVGFTHYGKETGTISGLNNGSPHEVDFNKNIISMDGSTVLTMGNSAFSVPYKLALFANNRAGRISEIATMILYHCQIYNGNTVIRNYIPCKNTAGAVGLYDLIGKKFYGNSDSGSFTAGPEVIWPSNDAIYVKINGVWKQIDGITIS